MERFDLNQTAKLAQLISVPSEQRDAAWIAAFLAAVPTASLASFDPQVQKGPDGFPYFQLALPDPGAFTPFSLIRILPDALTYGYGVVIHTNTRRDEQPAWVFSHGDMLAYGLFNDFNGDPKVYNLNQPPPDPNTSREILRSAPSQAYLPGGTRKAMGSFLRGPIQMSTPKVGLVDGPSLRPHRSLMVNLRLSDYHGDQQKLGAVMRYLTWFLPKSYSIMPLPDTWSDEGMVPL